MSVSAAGTAAEAALAFGAAAVALGCAGLMALRFTEPPHADGDKVGLGAQWGLLRTALRQPVLLWLFVLSVVMYGFSHVPFVFGQPFIAQAMQAGGWQGDAPIVSGAVSAAMMVVSVLASMASKTRQWPNRARTLGGCKGSGTHRSNARGNGNVSTQ